MNTPKGPDAAPGRSRRTRTGPVATAARIAWSSLPAILLTLATVACGQRGPLYLPDDRAAAPPAAEEEQQRDDPNLEEDDEETPGA